MGHRVAVCVLLALAANAGAEEAKKVEPRLVAGKFGKALDASSTPLAFAGDERYRTPPLTVECWAKLTDKRTFNVLVSCDPKASSRHWEVYTYARTGHFAAYLPGHEPAEVVSKTNVCDGKWHYLAFTFDGKAVKLYADGKLVHEQATKAKKDSKPKDGPLSIGQAIEGDKRIGCDGVIDDVRISRVIRDVSAVPEAALKVDKDTIALWQFDGADRVLADPEWTPPPKEGGEPWERMTDADWIDARFRKMDTGPVFDATFAYQHDGKRILVYKGTAIRLGEKGEAAVLFDRNQLRWAAGWTGDFLKHSDRRFGLLNTPTPAGTMAFSTASGPGWGDAKGELTNRHPATAPLPREWGRFNGLYLHGKHVVLSYSVAGVEVLESPWVETIAGQTVFVRNFEIAPSTKKLEPILAHLIGEGSHSLLVGNRHQIVTRSKKDQTSVVALLGDLGDKVEQSDAMGAHEKSSAVSWTAPPSKAVRRFRVLSWTGDSRQVAKLERAILELPHAAPDLSKWTKAGEERWGKPLVTKGEIAKDTAPHVVDTLAIPYDNPHNALFFCTGLDFLPDGRLALCTCHGDVWQVKHTDKLDRIEWKRFATGLYQPLGLKVVDGKIVVLERGQLTRLHDTNKDDEADFYENLCHDWHTGAGEHSYDTCLETDKDGNFYFFKTGDTNLPHGGCLLRVSKDGKKVETFATGFRHPIGLGVSPEGIVTGADQEGNWMPSTRVDVYKQGGFYGDFRAHHRKDAPKTYDGPLCWLPKEVDNSAGGQAWVAHDKFGLPKGQMLHLSYGRCKLYSLLTQKVDDVYQAGAVDLGVKFLSGSARARFNPRDGHLYVCGLNGWQTGAQKDGCLQRVRYTGQPLSVPTSLAFTKEGIRLGFPQKLDAKKAADGAKYKVEQWGYRWTANYGSARYSVKNPDRQGTDQLEVTSAVLSDDGKSVLIKVKELGPAMQVRIAYDVADADGKALTGTIHGTIHKLAAK